VRRILTVAAGIAATATAFALFTRLAWPWVALCWCTLVPWLAVLDRTPTLRSALLSAWALSAATTIALYAWFGLSIASYTGWAAPIVLIGLLVLGPFVEPQFLTFAAARHLLSRSGAGPMRTALTGACVYVASERLLPKLFGDTMGHAVYGSALWRQAADLAGVSGLTFLLVLGNEWIWAALRAASGPPHRRARRVAVPALSVASLIVALSGYGLWAYRAYGSPQAGAASVRAGIVQGNISHYEEMARQMGTYDAVRNILDTYFAMSAQLLEQSDGGLDAIVWPETVYPTTFGSPKSADGAAFDREITAFVDRVDVPLVFGSYDRDGTREFNAAVFLAPPNDAAPPVTMYRKTMLFPLTERVPPLLETPTVRSWLPWMGTWTPGDGARVVPLRLRDGRVIRIAPLICYDTIDSWVAIEAVRGGAELIVTLSNDSWFAVGPGPALHLMVAAFRSIETRRAQLRATNTGISAALTPTGDVLGVIDTDVRGSLVATVAAQSAPRTLIVAWGDWIGGPALAGALLLLGVATVQARR
jgi:apolipoprotein N-acyltransferase